MLPPSETDPPPYSDQGPAGFHSGLPNRQGTSLNPQRPIDSIPISRMTRASREPRISRAPLIHSHTPDVGRLSLEEPFDALGSDDEDIEMDVDKQLHGDGRNILFGISSTSTKDLTQQRNSLKELGLKRLTPREHFFVAICRDISLVLILKNCFVFWTKWYQMVTSEKGHSSFTSVWATEFFLAGIWCMVSGLLSYSILDGLMARWMVMYTVQAAIIRILSMSLLIIVLVELLNYMFNNSSNEFCLAAWIIISCVLTFVYIIQNYITSNLRLNEILLQDERNKEDMGLDTDDTTGDGSQDLPSSAAASSTAFDPNYRIPPPPSASLHRRNNDSSQHLRHGSRSQSQLGEAELKKPERPRRTVDLYNLTVFAVVPIGVASFITMCGLVRLVVILRLEIGLKLSQLLPK